MRLSTGADLFTLNEGRYNWWVWNVNAGNHRFYLWNGANQGYFIQANNVYIWLLSNMDTHYFYSRIEARDSALQRWRDDPNRSPKNRPKSGREKQIIINRNTKWIDIRVNLY